jgi:hypothetical protein
LAPIAVLAAGSGVTCKGADGQTYSGSPRPRQCTLPSDAENDAAAAKAIAAADSAEAAKAERLREKRLLQTYPNKAALDVARDRELQPIQKRLNASQAAEAELVAERRKIAIQQEFYKPPHRMDPDVQKASDDNAARSAAQHQITAGIQDEIEGVNAKFLERWIKLQKLWAAGR